MLREAGGPNCVAAVGDSPQLTLTATPRIPNAAKRQYRESCMRMPASIFLLPPGNRQGEDVTTMTRPNTAALAPLVTLLALMIVRCTGDSGPTGWIPRNGSVTGTIAVSSALPAAPLSDALDAPVSAVPLAMPLPTGLEAFRARRLA